MGTEVANAHAYTAVGNVSARHERGHTSASGAQCPAAIELRRGAADAGDPEAQYILGTVLFNEGETGAVHAGALRNLDRLFEQQEVGDL